MCAIVVFIFVLYSYALDIQLTDSSRGNMAVLGLEHVTPLLIGSLAAICSLSWHSITNDSGNTPESEQKELLFGLLCNSEGFAALLQRT